MPIKNIHYKNDLRRQPYDWQETIDYIHNGEPDKTKKKAEKVLNKINESLQN